MLSAGIITTTNTFAGILNNRSEKNVNLAIIGTGNRGGGLIPFVNQIEGIRVHACCDILSFRLESALKKAPGAKGYSDYRKVLEDNDIDAVLVATPFFLHDEVALDAIDAGKHVYCEKTMAKGYPAIQDLIKAVDHSNLVFQTGHQYHSSRLYTQVVKLIHEGKIGEIAAIECQWNRHGDWRRPVSDKKYEKAINWRMYKEFSGGLLAELCSHQLDFSNWILGETPITAMGSGGIDYWKDGRETFDNVHMIYTYPSGVKATFTCLTSNALDDYKIKVLGDKGTIILDYEKAWYIPEGGYEKEMGEADGVSGATINWQQDKGYRILVEHENPSKQALIDFKNNILEKKEPISNVKTGANAAICVQMGLDALYNQKIVSWPDFFFN